MGVGMPRAAPDSRVKRLHGMPWKEMDCSYQVGLEAMLTDMVAGEKRPEVHISACVVTDSER